MTKEKTKEVGVASAQAVNPDAQDGNPGWSLGTSAALAAGLYATTLTGCGGGGSATTQAISRFLGQAGFGATDKLIAEIEALEGGEAAWLYRQVSMQPTGPSHVDWMWSHNAQLWGNNEYWLFARTLWRQLVSHPDVVRARLSLALSEIFVVSQNFVSGMPQFALAHYLDTLNANCFGTYRQLIEAITLSPAMGLYLNMSGSKKGDVKTGRRPDENYARELLQLFSVGLYKLDDDGTIQNDASGRPKETYTQGEIEQLARVLTGWSVKGWTRVPGTYASSTCVPMVFNDKDHSTEEKDLTNLLGVKISAGSTNGAEELKQVLDGLAAHPNVAPFISRRLIQLLVTSNPSPDYIRRVVEVWRETSGSLSRVVTAVLLDPDARTISSLANDQWGKLREPMVRIIQLARTFEFKMIGSGPTLFAPKEGWSDIADFSARESNVPNSISVAGTIRKQYFGTDWCNAWGTGRYAEIDDFSDPTGCVGQQPFKAPSVFNFFQFDYAPPAFAKLGLVAPEFQIIDETSSIGYINTIKARIFRGISCGAKTDYKYEVSKIQGYLLKLDIRPDGRAGGDSPQARAVAEFLVDRYDLLLTGAVISTAAKQMMKTTVQSAWQYGINKKSKVAAPTESQRLVAIKLSIALVMCNPEYMHQR